MGPGQWVVKDRRPSINPAASPDAGDWEREWPRRPCVTGTRPARGIFKSP